MPRWGKQEKARTPFHLRRHGLDPGTRRQQYCHCIVRSVRDGNIGGVLSRTTSSGSFYYHYDNIGQLTDETITETTPLVDNNCHIAKSKYLDSRQRHAGMTVLTMLATAYAKEICDKSTFIALGKWDFVMMNEKIRKCGEWRGC